MLHKNLDAMCHEKWENLFIYTAKCKPIDWCIGEQFLKQNMIIWQNPFNVITVGVEDMDGENVHLRETSIGGSWVWAQVPPEIVEISPKPSEDKQWNLKDSCLR